MSSTAAISITDLTGRPPYESSLFLVLYDLITANPHFVAIMLHQSAREDKTSPNFLASFMSYASYLFQHNRNPRAFLYTRLMLTIMLSIVENQSIMNYMAKEQNAEFVRICRQVVIIKFVDHSFTERFLIMCSAQHHYHLSKRSDRCSALYWTSCLSF